MNLKLYQSYTRDELFAEFKNLQATEAEGWFLSSKRLVGLFAIGERPPEIHFCNSQTFHWYAQGDESVPTAIEKFKKQKGGYLFIKSPTDERYVYVAEIEHVGMYGGGPGQYEASMDVAPRVPTRLLHQLGGLYIHPDGKRAMNGPVEALRAARTADERFAAFQKFVEAWRGPLEDRHCLTDADLAKSTLPIPSVLKKLYRWAGACDDVMHAGYLSIRKPEELAVNDHGFVAFCVECQWCGNYYIKADALQAKDPEVFADECGNDRDGAGYHATGIGLSQFLWAYYIAFNVDGGPLSYWFEPYDDEFQRFKGTLNPLPILAEDSRSCRAIQAYRDEIPDEDEALLFARDGVMGYLTREEGACSMHWVSKTQTAVDKFVQLLDIDPSRLRDAT